MPNEKTLDDEMQDDMDDLPEIEVSLFDDPDDRVADAEQSGRPSGSRSTAISEIESTPSWRWRC